MMRPLVHFGVLASIVTGVALGVVAYRALSGASLLPSRLVGEAVRQIKANYIEPVTEEQLARDALRGMLRGLDRHSRFLDKDAFERLQADADGWFGGIGAEVALADGYFTVASTLDDSPAAQAGLLPGDRITAIDGTSLKGKRLKWVVKNLHGAPDTAVRLRVQRGRPAAGPKPQPRPDRLAQRPLALAGAGLRLRSHPPVQQADRRRVPKCPRHSDDGPATPNRRPGPRCARQHRRHPARLRGRSGRPA